MAHATAGHHSRATPSENAITPNPTPAQVEKLSMGWRPSRVVPALPLGVAIISIATAFTGFLLFLSGALVILNAYAPNSVPSSLLVLPIGDPIGATVALLVGTVFVGLANALWHQERWSLYLSVGLLFAFSTFLFFTQTITVLFVLVLLVFVYLLTVRDHFY